jgi:PKHD-type hydroxylase
MTYKNITNLPYQRSLLMYPLCHWDNVFTEDELCELEKYCTQLPLQSGKVIKTDANINGTVDKTVRKSKVGFINHSDENRWIFDKFNFAIELVNNNYYNFDINGYEFFQYAEYESSNLGEYNFHTDVFWGADSGMDDLPYEMRKLSVILFLSDPTSYTGGNFEFKVTDSKVTEIEQKRGRIVVFPSFLLHRVAPVTYGKRKSITAWVTGPKFK